MVITSNTVFGITHLVFLISFSFRERERPMHHCDGESVALILRETLEAAKVAAAEIFIMEQRSNRSVSNMHSQLSLRLIVFSVCII